MSLFLKRVYPTAGEYRTLEKSTGLAGSDGDIMGIGVTICLPGEGDNEAVRPSNASPFIARLHERDGAGTGEDYRMLLRMIIEKFFEGYQIEVRPDHYWRLLRNQAIRAELCPEDVEGSILLEERLRNPQKTAPDAVYMLERVAEHDFLADLLDTPFDPDAPKDRRSDEQDRPLFGEDDDDMPW